ncbi:hypothetical protein XENORESO_017076 [Xenotaenia resolanae]|uniref:Uncharacterized protein n=1 Tax=Xenotaenia resolanae TaxID=208358 RepID=A0ABV0VM85_9TELE
MFSTAIGPFLTKLRPPHRLQDLQDYSNIRASKQIRTTSFICEGKHDPAAISVLGTYVPAAFWQSSHKDYHHRYHSCTKIPHNLKNFNIYTRGFFSSTICFSLAVKEKEQAVLSSAYQQHEGIQVSLRTHRFFLNPLTR